MSYIIKAETELTPEDIKAIHHLTELCREYDGLTYIFDQDSDFKKETDINTFLLYQDGCLLSFISLFAPGKMEAELSAFTHPDHRKKGYFSVLLKEAKKEIKRREIPDILLVCDMHSSDGNHVVKHLSAQYDFSEYTMKFNPKEKQEGPETKGLDIRKSAEKDLQNLKRISMISFDDTEEFVDNYMKEVFTSEKREFYTILLNQKIVGMVGVYRDVKSNYIHGFCIDPAFRKKGLGLASLIRVVNLYKEKEPDKIIELEVQVDNINALSIYEKAGFRIITIYNYSRLKVS